MTKRSWVAALAGYAPVLTRQGNDLAALVEERALLRQQRMLPARQRGPYDVTLYEDAEGKVVAGADDFGGR